MEWAGRPDRLHLRPREGARKPALDGGDAAQLGAPKALGLEIARERTVPAHIEFPARLLIDMVRRRPRTEAEFAGVDGVGTARPKEFAGPFLAASRARRPRRHER